MGKKKKNETVEEVKIDEQINSDTSNEEVKVEEPKSKKKKKKNTKEKQEEISELVNMEDSSKNEQINSDINNEEVEEPKPKKKKKKKIKEKQEEISELVNMEDSSKNEQINSDINNEEVEEPKSKKKKKKKKNKSLEEENILDTNENNANEENITINDENTTTNESIISNSESTTNNENSSSIPKNINEDLYAPFGDKTFKKDELLDTNNSNNDISNGMYNVEQNTNNSINSDIDINRIKNDNEYLEHLDESVIKENLKQKKTPEEQNEFDLQMIKNYMGKKYVGFVKSKFNIYACIFGGIYLMYRKMYIYGISLYLFFLILMTLFINNFMILGIVVALIICIHVVLGFNFNKIYLNRSYNQIKKIEEIYNANQDDYVLSECKYIGGTDIAKVIIILTVIGAIVIYGILQISNFTKL